MCVDVTAGDALPLTAMCVGVQPHCSRRACATPNAAIAPRVADEGRRPVLGVGAHEVRREGRRHVGEHLGVVGLVRLVGARVAAGRLEEEVARERAALREAL